MTHEGDSLPLSDIIKSSQAFGLVDELSYVESLIPELESTSSRLSLAKIERIIDDITAYFDSLHDLFSEIDEAAIEGKLSMNWIWKGRDEISSLNKRFEQCDQLVSTLLEQLENIMEETANDPRHDTILTKFSQICELTIEIKKYIIPYRKKISISNQFHELDSLILKSISSEIEECLKATKDVKEQRFLSPIRYTPKLKLETISQMMNNGSQINLKLPTFNKLDESLYHNFSALQKRLEPINAALMFVPQTLESYSELAKEHYPDSILNLIDKYENLVESYQKLREESNMLKHELIDYRWEEIFRTVVNEIEQSLRELEVQLNNNDFQQVDEIMNEYDLEESFDIFKRAIAEQLVKDTDTLQRHQELSAHYIELKDEFYMKQSRRLLNLKSEVSTTDSEPTLRNETCTSVISKKNDIRIKNGTAIIDCLQLKPIMIEHNPTSPQKKKVLGDISNSSSAGSDCSVKRNSRNIIQKLLHEIGNKENGFISAPDPIDIIVEDIGHLDVSDSISEKHESFNATNIFNSPDPFLTPSAKLNKKRATQHLVSPINEFTKPLKYVPLPVSHPLHTKKKQTPSPPQSIESLRVPKCPSKIPTRTSYNIYPSKIPLPVRSDSRLAILRSESKLSNVRSQSSMGICHRSSVTQESYSSNFTSGLDSADTRSKVERPQSRLERLGSTMSSKLGTKSPLVVTTTRCRTSMSTPYSHIQNLKMASSSGSLGTKLRAQSSMGTARGQLNFSRSRRICSSGDAKTTNIVS
ncbi:hypothetical protein CANARDRAFT_25159 [[Candida] arabinofermentans NRRL YB-2248]|uniref:Karyogamy protein n=1 Tax=[Candida] arabinofermentans NRRL YB-2248 TaxID=983967 RepID=A0A1E4SV22_9ASCO|nr:hypothetical protein CANARDRAFT_25159 [[Candida] arabinofermentans NRRL YB-2248]